MQWSIIRFQDDFATRSGVKFNNYTKVNLIWCSNWLTQIRSSLQYFWLIILYQIIRNQKKLQSCLKNTNDLFFLVFLTSVALPSNGFSCFHTVTLVAQVALYLSAFFKLLTTSASTISYYQTAKTVPWRTLNLISFRASSSHFFPNNFALKQTISVEESIFQFSWYFHHLKYECPFFPDFDSCIKIL